MNWLDDLKSFIWGWFRYDVSLIQQVLKGQKEIMATLADLKTEVAKVKTVADSAVILIQGISQQLKDALAQNDPAAIQAVIDELDADVKPLSDAVAANTTPAA